MSLATRCPSCGTVFRVAQDQLEVSEGWVRCGRCSGVFNAGEVLFDIDSGTAVHPKPGTASGPLPADTGADTEPTVTDWTPPAGPAPRPASRGAGARRLDAGRPEGRQEPSLDGGDLTPQDLEGLAAATPEAAGRHARRETSLLRMPSTAVDDSPRQIDTPSRFGTLPPSTGPGELRAADDAPVMPSFLRAADHAALWRQPAVRGALVTGVVLLALGLVAQATWTWRDLLAAHVPASAPALHALCRIAGCQLQPLRRIDALAVDSSSLHRVEGSALYRLQLVLHNRADTALMMPALDLSLTDAQGKLVTRRVLQMAELGVPQATLQAGQELPIKVLISTGERRVEGYTVELFYP